MFLAEVTRRCAPQDPQAEEAAFVPVLQAVLRAESGVREVLLYRVREEFHPEVRPGPPPPITHGREAL